MIDLLSMLMQLGAQCEVQKTVNVSLGATAIKILSSDSMRFAVLLSSTANNGVFWGMDSSINNTSGMVITSTASPIILTQLLTPGLPQSEFWAGGMLGSTITYQVIRMLPVNAGGEFQSPQTALNRLQGLGIIDSNLQRTGPMATPEEHIAATIKQTSPILPVPVDLQLEQYNARTRALQTEIDAVRRNRANIRYSGRGIVPGS